VTSETKPSILTGLEIQMPSKLVYVLSQEAYVFSESWKKLKMCQYNICFDLFGKLLSKWLTLQIQNCAYICKLVLISGGRPEASKCNLNFQSAARPQAPTLHCLLYLLNINLKGFWNKKKIVPSWLWPCIAHPIYLVKKNKKWPNNWKGKNTNTLHKIGR